MSQGQITAVVTLMVLVGLCWVARRFGVFWGCVALVAVCALAGSQAAPVRRLVVAVADVWEVPSNAVQKVVGK